MWNGQLTGMSGVRCASLSEGQGQENPGCPTQPLVCSQIIDRISIAITVYRPGSTAIVTRWADAVFPFVNGGTACGQHHAVGIIPTERAHELWISADVIVTGIHIVAADAALDVLGTVVETYSPTLPTCIRGLSPSAYGGKWLKNVRLTSFAAKACRIQMVVLLTPLDAKQVRINVHDDGAGLRFVGPQFAAGNSRRAGPSG